MIERLAIVHSNNGGWTTFEREARLGLEGRVPHLEHVTITEPLVVRTLAKRLPAKLDRGTKRVRQMWAWGKSRVIEEAVEPVGPNGAALVVTQRRALRLASMAPHRRPGVLATMGDAVAAQFREGFGMPASQAAALARLERRVFEHVDVALFLSAWAADRARDEYAGTGCRFVAVPPTMDDPYPDGPPVDGRTGRRLLFVGNDFLRKGGDLLLEAYRRDALPGTELVIASRTRPPRDLPRGVRWRQAATRQEVLQELLPTSDVLVLPTRQDMSPWVVVEAMAAGLPVVATDRGAIGELVADGSTGLLFDEPQLDVLVDTLRHVLAEDGFREQAGVLARRTYEERHRGEAGWNVLLDELAKGRAEAAEPGAAPPAGRTAPISLLLATTGDPSDPTARSGVPNNLLEVLDASDTVSVVAAVDTSLGPVTKLVAAPFSVVPNVRVWRSRMHRNRIATMTRTLRLQRAARRHRPFDAILAVRSTYYPLPYPYIPFCDSALSLTEPTGFAAGNYRWALQSARRRERRYLRQATHIFTASHHLAESITRTYGIPPERVTTVGGGTNYRPEPVPYASRTPASILFVGRDFERKGGPDLLAAFELVRAAVPEATLTVVGTELSALPPGVECLGFVSDRQRLRELYRQAAVMVLPSRWEPYGLVLLEAMAHALPCVATTVGTIPDIVEDGVTGLLVPPAQPRPLADAIITLLQDPERSAAMGEAGHRRVVEQMRWDHVVERMQAILGSALRS